MNDKSFFGTGLGKKERERAERQKEKERACRGNEWIISDSWKINRAENCECHLKNYIFDAMRRHMAKLSY